ncbi:hypothetical protein SETIT_1G232600v2 [Setaria italica]|uniref:SPRY domain-containing protein n=1 Tax=Setaria italica TaxID=4555 RepID=K3YRT4_SETIT|nr:uncharacterized protein LOC101758003 [Setaria italica]RCV07298.1 hypothetical protein SETIT_1G232600v2 [Setaria italica]
MAVLWLRLLLAVGLPIAALVAVAFLVYRRRSSPRNAPPELPEVAPAAGVEPTASPGLAKLNMRYSTASARVGLRFQQLHQHHHRVDVRHRGPGGAQQGPFQWADHPRLVTEAAENGWAQFVFAVAPPRSKSASSSPLWGTCPICDADTSRDMAEAAAWELPAGSSERMQAVRLNPAAAAAAASSTKRWLPGSIPSPLRGDADAGNNPSALCLARMSLPLPGPPLAGAPFPQDAYFEITIIYLNTKRPEWSASRASRRGRDGASESDRVKLISFAPDAKDPVQESRASKDDQQDKQRHLVMSLGLAVASAAPARPALAGTYASSIGFYSNGAVYLDGMKLVYESDKSSWVGVDKVVGCGFEPAKRKVFFTVDGQLVHAVSCNAEAFASPLYPVLASSFDVMALVNLGQGKFRYAPANARRTANPCFVRAASAVDARGGGGGSDSMGLDFDDSGELFSMGRVDSGWMEALRASKSRKDSVTGSGAASVGDPEAESDLFEISLRD